MLVFWFQQEYVLFNIVKLSLIRSYFAAHWLIRTTLRATQKSERDTSVQPKQSAGICIAKVVSGSRMGMAGTMEHVVPNCAFIAFMHLPLRVTPHWLHAFRTV